MTPVDEMVARLEANLIRINAMLDQGLKVGLVDEDISRMKDLVRISLRLLNDPRVDQGRG